MRSERGREGSSKTRKEEGGFGVAAAAETREGEGRRICIFRRICGAGTRQEEGFLFRQGVQLTIKRKQCQTEIFW